MDKSHSSFPRQDIMTPEAPTVYTKAYGDLRKKKKIPAKKICPIIENTICYIEIY